MLLSGKTKQWYTGIMKVEKTHTFMPFCESEAMYHLHKQHGLKGMKTRVMMVTPYIWLFF